MLRGAIVNTPLGLFAQNLRGRLELYRAATTSPETLGTLANDAIARSLLERLCADDRAFIDVGAHIGSVIDGVRRSSRPSRIVAIEAIPEKVDALRRKFPEVEVHGCAVGDAEGEIAFYVDLKRSGYSSLDPALSSLGNDVREIRVPLRKLDNLIAPDGIGLIKIDVEGAELGVLKGAESIFSTSRPVVMFESGAGEMDGFTKVSLWRWFKERDYVIVVPNRVAHMDDGMSEEVFLESHLYPRRTTNYYAVARESRQILRARARDVLGLE